MPLETAQGDCHLPFKQKFAGSNPVRGTNLLEGMQAALHLVLKTSTQGENPAGSTPVPSSSLSPVSSAELEQVVSTH